MIDISHFIKEIFGARKILRLLITYDFKSDYLASYLGVVWAFVNPLISTLLLWFIFSVGFKSQPIKDTPFIVWLVCGLFPWQFITQAVINGSSSVTGQSYLVKKIVFRVELLPLIKISSAVIIHIFFILLICVFMLVYHVEFTLHILQLPYFIFGMLLLLLGLTWLTSALTVFVRDLNSVITISMQFLFWGTPVFWSIKMLPEHLQFWMKLNPFYYIIQGYRSSFITREWFWEDPTATICFWGITLLIFFFGAFVFQRLRPHFADVL
jgi:ABC-type polysaccharide/polyol phosphate export permease